MPTPTLLRRAPALLLGAALLLNGCKNDDFLNVESKSAVTEVSAYSNETNADLIVNDIYNNIPSSSNDPTQTLEQYADNSFCGAGWETGQSVVRAGAISPANVPNGPSSMWRWEDNYSRIRKCNLFLQNVEKYSTNFSASWKTQRVGEVKFLRALYYTYLFTSYGGVALIDKPLDATTDPDGLFVARSTIDQTLAFIVADCDAAAASLPTTAARKGDGRATKGAALALKGWAQLFAASPLANTSNDVAKWAAAAATNKQVLDLNVYSLFPDLGTFFLQENNDNQEVIFNKEYIAVTAGHSKEGTYGPVNVNGVTQGWGNYQPTQSLVDDYLMSNGLPITDPASGYDPQNPYANREKRFYQSILYDGAPWQSDILTMRIGGNNQIDLNSTSDISNTGYYGRKTLDERIPAQTSRALNASGANYVIFRLGEVLLSYAEAQNEAVGPGAGVYSALNQLRKRAGLPDLAAGMSQSQLRDYIRRERRIELAFEDKRWFDIRRWKITAGSTGVLNTPSMGMLITPDKATGKLTYAKVKVFENRFFDFQNWMPIPQEDIAKNTKLVQNAGY
ncbi:RagB/SusD family nutrient uptake outer membrane protein [Hymenobacter setariae]|nr:RagB/SusD family nutrient uptake outer membrane protein [Hymenobacter setariae]